MSIFKSDLDEIEKSITTLCLISDGVEKYGINQTSLYILKRHHLLSGASLSTLAIESINDSTQVTALEALSEDIKEKSAQWAAKVVGLFKDGSKAITDKLTTLLESVKEKAALLTDKAWDVAKDTKDLVVAHPYKTILIALSAAVAIFGIVSFVGTSLPVGVVTNGQLHTFMMRLRTMYHGINLPFGKITTTAVSDGRLVFATVETANKVNSAAQTGLGGWSVQAVKAVLSQTDKVVSGVKKGFEVLWNRALKPGEKVLSGVLFAPKDFKEFVVNKTGARSAGWVLDQVVPALYYSILYKLLRNLYDITKDIVFKTIKMIKDTFTSLTKATA